MAKNIIPNLMGEVKKKKNKMSFAEFERNVVIDTTEHHPVKKMKIGKKIFDF